MAAVEQQAPRRVVQGFVGVQVAPTPWNALVPVQPTAVVCVQVPEELQQAPRRAVQGFVGVHATPEPPKVAVAEPKQASCRACVQVPELEQQAPRLQGLVPQLVP